MEKSSKLKNFNLLTPTPAIKSAITTFCSPSSSGRARHNALRFLTTAVTAEIDFPVVSSTRKTVDGGEQEYAIPDTVVGVPIVRAGVAMAPAFKRAVPNAQIALIGAKRGYDENGKTNAATYLDELPDMSKNSAYLLDTVLATGVSVDIAADIAKSHNCRDLSLITALAAPEGIKYLNDRHPDLKIFAAYLAQGLNKKSYIYNPTPGDAGDNLFGASEKWQDVVKNFKTTPDLDMYLKD
jgi:uracil phosphoribosyltransferase